MANLLDEWSSQRYKRMRCELHEDVYKFKCSTREKRYHEHYRGDFEHKGLQFAELRNILQTTGSPYELIACLDYMADRLEQKRQQYDIASNRYRTLQRTLDNICMAAKLNPYPYIKANFSGEMCKSDNRIYKAGKYLIMVQNRKFALRYYDKLMRYVDSASRVDRNVAVRSQEMEDRNKDATDSSIESEGEEDNMEEAGKPRDKDHEGEDCVISDTEDVQKVDL